MIYFYILKQKVMKYFTNCTNIQEVKATYKTLAKNFPPDLSGYDTTAIMQEINTEYSFVCAKLSKGENITEAESQATILEAEAYRQALEKVITLQGISIELVGNWIWITGNTYPVKNDIKSAGFQFASVKKAWFFRTEEYKASCRGKMQTLDQIKNKYGCQVINNKPNYKTLKL